MKKETVIAALSSIEEKDFDTLIRSVESAIEEDKKANEAYKGFDPTRGTLASYRAAEQKWKIAYLQRLLKLTAFFDLFTGKSATYNGRSFVRRVGPEGKLHVNEKDCLEIDANTPLKKGDVVDLWISKTWVSVTIEYDEEKKEWYAQDLRGLQLYGRKARKAVSLDKAEVNKKVNEKKW